MVGDQVTSTDGWWTNYCRAGLLEYSLPEAELNSPEPIVKVTFIITLYSLQLRKG